MCIRDRLNTKVSSTREGNSEEPQINDDRMEDPSLQEMEDIQHLKNFKAPGVDLNLKQTNKIRRHRRRDA